MPIPYSEIFISSSHNDSQITQSRLSIFIQYFVYSFCRIPRYKSSTTRVVLRSPCHFSHRSITSCNIKLSDFPWKIRAKLFDTGQAVVPSETCSDRENIKMYDVVYFLKHCVSTIWLSLELSNDRFSLIRNVHRRNANEKCCEKITDISQIIVNFTEKE